MKAVVAGERGFAIHGITVEHCGPKIGIPQTGLRNLVIRFSTGDEVRIESTSDSELELLGKVLVRHAKGTDQYVRVDTEDRITAAAYGATMHERLMKDNGICSHGVPAKTCQFCDPD